jgi:precorrin-2 dehydrogenase/sirohydrochlorin ferrochelatase
MAKNKKEIYLPVLLDITDKKILLIGAGNACREKLNSLSQLKTDITVISPVFHDDFKNKAWIHTIQREYRKNDLKGFDIVYIGINNPETEKEIYEESRNLNVLVNFVDKVEYSDFISPSLIKRENFSIFISTYGKGPGAAKKIRQTIENQIDLDQIDMETDKYIKERNKKKSVSKD